MDVSQIGANTSCLPNNSLQEAVNTLRRLGFRGITLLAFLGTRHRYGDLAGFWFREMKADDRHQLKEIAAGFDRLVLHAPFVDLPLFTYDPRVKRLAIDRVEESLDAAAYLEASVVTVHANRRSNYAVGEFWNDLVDTFRELGDYAGERGVQIGLETGYPDVVDNFIDLLEAIGHPAVGATLDTGHLVRYVDPGLQRTPEGVVQLNEQLMDMTRQLGPLVIHCHLHDVRAADWQDHVALGRGVLDLRPVLAHLASLDYQGMLELELEEPDAMVALTESKRRLETMVRQVGKPQRKAA